MYMTKGIVNDIFSYVQNGGNISVFFAGREKGNDPCFCYVIHSYMNGLDIYIF